VRTGRPSFTAHPLTGPPVVCLRPRGGYIAVAQVLLQQGRVAFSRLAEAAAPRQLHRACFEVEAEDLLIRDRYELAAGELVLDLRGTDLPAGDTPIALDIGMGEATLLVPDDVCVASRADIGVGAIDVFDRQNEGVDLDWEDLPRAADGNSRVILDAEVGMGEVHVANDRPFGGFESGRFDGNFDSGDRSANTGCEPSTLSVGGR